MYHASKYLLHIVIHPIWNLSFCKVYFAKLPVLGVEYKHLVLG